MRSVGYMGRRSDLAKSGGIEIQFLIIQPKQEAIDKRPFLG